MQDVELGGGYRLHRRDQMNWELQEWREPAKDSGGRIARSREASWRGLGKYYQTLGGALAAVFELRMRDGDEATDLRGAMERAEEIRAELLSVRTRPGDPR